MESFRNFEIGLTLMIQNLGAWLTMPMLILSFFGREEFYLMVMPLIYWCIDTRLGIRIGAMVLVCNWVNISLKMLFHSPRPYWVNLNIKAISSETSFGMPSGHAQNAAGIWGLLAAFLKDRRWKVLIILAIFLIGFSRLYLGVHFISDIGVGWLIGGLLFWLFIKLEDPFYNWLKKRSLFQITFLSIVSSLVILFVPLLIRIYWINWQIPQVWVQNVAVSAPGSPISPMGISDAVSLAGTWLGMTLGISWIYIVSGGYSSTGSPRQKMIRYFIGMAGLIIIWAGLDKIFPDNSNLVGYIFRYARYALIGLWITCLAPLTFRRLRLLADGKYIRLPYNVNK
jgi:membrane-associated phospholipid phosphatase